MYSWSIRYQFDPKDSKTHLHEDNLTEADVLSMLCLSLRPGLQNNRPCTVTIDQGQDTRLVVHLFPTERKSNTSARPARNSYSKKRSAK